MINKSKYKYKNLINFQGLAQNNQKLLDLKKLYLIRNNKTEIKITYNYNDKLLKIETRIGNKRFEDNSSIYLKLKKKKWQRLLYNVLNKFQYYYISNYKGYFENMYNKIYDQNLYNIPKYSNFFTKRFKENLITNKQLKIFYGYLKNKYFLNLVKKLDTKQIVFLNHLESRLDVILVKSNFTLSIKNAQQLISHGHIYVNGINIKTKSFKIKKGDYITIDKKIYSLVEYFILNSLMWPSLPKYLQIDYNIFQIILISDIYVNNSNYYFWLNFKNLTKYN